METKKTNTHISDLIESFDDKAEENAVLTDEQKRRLSEMVPTQDDLREGLPTLLQKADDLKNNVDNCDKNIKSWQESKKMWSARCKSFLETLGLVLERLNVPGSTMKADGVKLSTSKRSSIEVDEDWLVSRYEPMAAALQGQLPDYVKVSLTIDKNRLAAFLKTDDTMLVDNPDKIHTKTTLSTSIK